MYPETTSQEKWTSNVSKYKYLKIIISSNMSPILILMKKMPPFPPQLRGEKSGATNFRSVHNDLSFFLQLTKPQLKITQQGVSAYIIVISSLKKNEKNTWDLTTPRVFLEAFLQESPKFPSLTNNHRPVELG